MNKRVTFVLARPSGDDKNLLAFHANKKFSKNGKTVCEQIAEKAGIETSRVIRAYHGKTVLISEAHAIAKVFRLKQIELFFKRRESSRKQRTKPRKLFLQA